MGLENLKSVFSNIVTNKTQSDITSFSTELDDIRPISINGISTLDSSFDNLSLIPVIDINSSKLADLPVPQPFPNLDGLGLTPLTDSGASWEMLYNNDHSPKEISNPNPTNPLEPYLYGSSVSRQNLNIRGVSSRRSSLSNPSRSDEPYIIHGIPTMDNQIGGTGRAKNSGGRSIPLVRSLTDTLRITQFLSSPAGISFIAKQNALGIVGSSSESPSVNDPDSRITISPQRFGALYNPLSTLHAVGGGSLVGENSRINGYGIPDYLVRRDYQIGDLQGLDVGGLFTINQQGSYDKTVRNRNLHSTFGGYNQFSSNISSRLVDTSTNFPVAAGQKFINKNTTKRAGDKMTLMEYGEKSEGRYKDKLEDAYPNDSQAIESPKNGMPFYIKDLRDGAFVFFRAYLDGINENISPSWSESNYIGRSEPVYVYERTSRDIAFNLTVFAQTQDELDSIYKKMNRLTSMCYPEYMKDESFTSPNIIKMKPPLTKLRLGDLYGRKDNELTGFLKSISYTVPESSPWETKQNKRVPKYIVASISYQVIHGKVPQLKNNEKDYEFYGFTGGS